ncbi:MAG: aldehyde dehydrogenase family protein [Sandaracinus sp.]|nr:aldehyde dehydrogenase family protein [Sandaracinus sp.]
MSVSHVESAPSTSLDSIPRLVDEVRERFDSGITRSIDWRLRQLDAIGRFVEERESEILAALKSDLGKPEIEAFSAEVSFVANDVAHAKKHLRGWMKAEKVSSPLVVQPGQSFIVREPLGVALIISPWNYPFQLLMAPLVSAIAAGNCAVLKPSEVSPATSALFAKWIPRYLDGCVKVVEGGVPETTRLLEQRFDHIFYTGNGKVARIVMAAAAKNLTPVTLELGGKSPCIVDASADLDVTAKRIVLGKFYNAGQTCVAPDYVLVEESVHDALLNRLVATIRSFYGDDPQRSPDLARIVNERHLQRLVRLLEGQTIACGGQHDAKDRFLAPTVLRDVSPDSDVMQEEIFGPILPVIAVPHVDAAITFVNRRDKPLALYVFSQRESVQAKVRDRTSSGGMSINHVWLHLAVPELPFGGVGESGMGAYHGKHGFEAFSHRKAVLKKPTQIDPSIMYPPYTESKQKWMKRLL